MTPCEIGMGLVDMLPPHNYLTPLKHRWWHYRRGAKTFGRLPVKRSLHAHNEPRRRVLWLHHLQGMEVQKAEWPQRVDFPTQAACLKSTHLTHWATWLPRGTVAPDAPSLDKGWAPPTAALANTLMAASWEPLVSGLGWCWVMFCHTHSTLRGRCYHGRLAPDYTATRW